MPQLPIPITYAMAEIIGIGRKIKNYGKSIN
jgi:hypothetical protein